MGERHLRTALVDEAERHHPDRAAMRARIGRGQAAAARRPVARLRAALAGTSAAATADAPASAPVGGTAPPVRDNFLAAAGVLDPYPTTGWSRSDLTLTAAEKLTTLKVTVRIVHTAGVADAGHRTSIPAERTTTTVAEDDHELVYRFALTDGATLAPGRYTFAAQYRHAGARGPAGDSYLAAARGVSTAKAEVTGVFKPR